MRIPAYHRIIDRALDQRSDAMRQNDRPTIAHLDTLISNLYRGAGLKWAADGALWVASANTPGARYVVTDRSCDCLARGLCWHRRCRDMLVEMLETEAETADMAAAH